MSLATAAKVIALIGLGVPSAGVSQVADSVAQAPDTVGPTQVTVTDTPSPDGANPFAGFETHYLSNGLKVWLKRVPGAPNVSVSVAVPFGSHSDPPGKEGLAHFTEHTLFSDHEGRSEQEVKDAIESLGGRRNGFTASDHTWYYATIDKQHGLFAIEWLSDVLAPHAMEPAVVDRNRQPIAIETNAKPREVFEHVWAFLNPSFLLPADFWQREFGMDTRGLRSIDRWKTLQAIGPDDLRAFYDTYYAPGAMTLTIVGDLEPEQAMATAERTFGTLPRRPVPAPAINIEDPNRARTIYSWGFPATVRYATRFKFFHPGAEDELMILFMRDFLSRRLNQRLRYGDQKAVYGLRVSAAKRGPAAFLEVGGQIDEGEYDFALGVIEEEIQSLRTAALDSASFAADRTAVIERLRSGNQTSEALNFWVYRNFYDPATFTDFPDVLGFYQDVSQEAVASFAARNLVPERQVLSVLRSHPISQELMVVAVLLLAWLTVRLVGWGLTSPVAMRDIQYIARFRVPLVFRVVSFLVIGGVGLVLARITFFGLQWITLTYVATIDDYVIQMGSFALILVAVLGLAIMYLARFPKKLLVFPDHIRIKSLAYRSRSLKPEDVQEISIRRFHRVWFSKDLLRCYPMTLGLLRPGVYLRPVKGRAYFFRSRDTKELLDVLGTWRGEPVTKFVPAPPTETKPDQPVVPAAGPVAPTPRQDAPPVDQAPPVDEGAPSQKEPHVEEPLDDDIDYDSIGLTAAEMEELLGETKRDDL